MQSDEAKNFLQMKGVTKFFPGIKALDCVDLSLNRGEVLALLGENGAGKSTLMKVLGGVHLPDEGEIYLNGEKVEVESVQKATQLGVAFVHQELNLSDNLDVAANVFLGREPKSLGFMGIIDRNTIYKDAAEVLARINLEVDPKTLVEDLAIGTRQMIEIAKALSINAKILIMDEPTSSLSQHETEQLFKVIKQLKEQGVSIIYISHRLGEVEEVADRVLVLRDGAVSGQLSKQEINHDNMIRLMVGRDIDKFFRQSQRAAGDIVLEVRDYVMAGHPNQTLNFKLHEGEILVLAGLVGAGRTDLAHTLFGIEKPLAGEVFLNGRPLGIENPQDAISAGMGLVPEDRKLHGLIVEMTVEENISLAGLKQWANRGMIDFTQSKKLAHDMVELLSIRLREVSQVAESLSGGNQQKVVLGKWLSLKPKVLLLDEPTRGIDVVAKEEIYHLMQKLAAQKVAMLVISSEMHEVLGIADRILVMHEGGICGQLEKDQFSEEAVVRLATGGL